MLKPHEDAQGQAMYDTLHGHRAFEIIERDDGFIDVGAFGANSYIAEYPDWSPQQRKAIRYARGRVLDIGCGAGRCCLYLQKKGHEVLGIDISPMAIKTCQERGVKNTRVLSIGQVNKKLGEFDTIIMYGNNFGLFGSFAYAQKLLRRFHTLTSAKGRIIAEVGDPYITKVPEHLEYHRRNRKQGRMGGQIRLRVRYKKMKTPWIDYLFASPAELKKILKGTGWYVNKMFHPGEFTYTVVIDKT